MSLGIGFLELHLFEAFGSRRLLHGAPHDGLRLVEEHDARVVAVIRLLPNQFIERSYHWHAQKEGIQIMEAKGQGVPHQREGTDQAEQNDRAPCKQPEQLNVADYDGSDDRQDEKELPEHEGNRNLSLPGRKEPSLAERS